MNSDTIIEVVSALVGEVEAVGETHEDKRRLENLKKMIDLSDHLLQKIYEASLTRYRVEASMKEIGEQAHKYLLSTRDWSEE